MSTESTIAMPRRMWSVTGWPHLYRDKAYSVIRDYDQLVMKSLDWVHAQKLLELDNFNLYRIDRESVMKFLAERVPLVSRIDFGSADGNLIFSKAFKLLGGKEQKKLSLRILQTRQLSTSSMP